MVVCRYVEMYHSLHVILYECDLWHGGNGTWVLSDEPDFVDSPSGLQSTLHVLKKMRRK